MFHSLDPENKFIAGNSPKKKQNRAVKPSQKFSEKQVKRLLISLLSELTLLHSQHKIQGNINPQEITIYKSESLKASLPFNPLNEVNSSKNIGSLLISTPGFIPPEQAEGKPVLGSDIYALGLTAIYWLTGKTPDKLPSDLVTGAILWHPYALNISPEFCRVLDRAIKADPSERYANAGEMLAELRPMLSISLSDDGPSSLSQATWKRSLISLGIVGISVFAIGFYLGTQKTPENSTKKETVQTPPVLTPSQIPSPVESEPAPVALKDLDAEKARLEAENKRLKQIQAEQSQKVTSKTLPVPEPPKTTKKTQDPPPVVYRPAIPTTYLDLTLTNKYTWRRQMPVKSVVLTFDDGPSPEYTGQVLDILKKHQVKATFFVVGERVRENCPLVQRIVSEGHELGNHSYNHPFLWKNSEAWQRKQMEDTQQAIAECLATWIPQQYTSTYMPRWFRAPYAAQDSNTVAAAHSLGLNTAMWSIDTQDWRKNSTSNSILREATQSGGQDIILMHDATEAGFNFRHPEAALTRQNTIDALDSLITQLKAQGIQMVTMTEAFNTYPSDTAQN